MHDLVRELAIFQSKREGFSTTYDGNNEAMLVGSEARRLTVLQCGKDIPSTIDPSRLRTFITFDNSSALSLWYSSISSKPKYLSVLDLSGLPIETIPNSIGELFNLRLLCLNDTKVKEFSKSITKLQNLQILSLENAELVKFPQEFSKLKKLRHLMVSRLQDVTYSSFKSWEAVEPFKGLWSLIELQTLYAITASEVLVAKLGNLSQMRSLVICDGRHCHQRDRRSAAAGQTRVHAVAWSWAVAQGFGTIWVFCTSRDLAESRAILVRIARQNCHAASDPRFTMNKASTPPPLV
uniref:Disease resistance R13L4/SHOC-2-like LRR domain-containing protein n=1 Tax=Zea mays TaxID=4577 RepID=A0A804U9R7_MAIZE